MATPGARYATLKQDTEFVDWSSPGLSAPPTVIVPAGTIVEVRLNNFTIRTDPILVYRLSCGSLKTKIPVAHAPLSLDFLE